MRRTVSLPRSGFFAGLCMLVLLGPASDASADVFVLQGEPGAAGADGAAGAQGTPGANGTACWDLDGDGLPSLLTEDVDGDGDVDIDDCKGADGVDGVDGTNGLDGAPGPTGATGANGLDGVDGANGADGADGVDGAAGAAGADGADGLACWDLDGDGSPNLLTEDSNGDGDVDVDDCRSSSDCPLGFVLDPSETQFTLCYDPDTTVLGPDEMVLVGDFWVDRYESSVWDNADCTGTQYGTTSADDYPATFPNTGFWTQPLYACSVAGVPPSRMLTWLQAQQSCSLAGKALCSNQQWQAAVAGTVDPGSFDGDGGGACNTLSGLGNARATGAAGDSPSAADSCMSAWGAEDMIGNLWEWGTDWYASGLTPQYLDGQATVPWPAGYHDDAIWNVNGRAQNGVDWVDGSPAATTRGGSWADGTDAGSFSMSLSRGPTHFEDIIGFRCCRGR